MLCVFFMFITCFFFFFFSSIASNAEEARGRGLDNDSLAIYLITGLKKTKKNNGADAVRRFFSYGSPHYFSFFVQRVFFTGFVLLFCFFFNTRLDRFVMEVAGVYRFFFVVIEKKKKRNGYRYRSRSVPRCFVSFFCCFFLYSFESRFRTVCFCLTLITRSVCFLFLFLRVFFSFAGRR